MLKQNTQTLNQNKMQLSAIEELFNIWLNREYITPNEWSDAIEKDEEQRRVTENTSDGFHTFKELYEFRKAYNVALFNEWGKYRINKPEDKMEMCMYDVHKSWKHHDGELCFGGGWFIVVAYLPEGQISNHYEAKDWDLFKIPERDTATYPFDGHTGQDVINRLLKLY